MACHVCELASGYKIVFVPTDEQIISDFLFNKVHGHPLPSDEIIIDCNLYGEHHAWQKLFEEKGESILYFFTTLIKKTEKSKRIERVTTCGSTWRSQSDQKILDNHKQHIGSKRNFSFVPKKGGGGDDDHQVKGTGWVMHEFRLDGILLNDKAIDLVLCRISKNIAVKNEEESNDNNTRTVSWVFDRVCICSAMLPSGFKILFFPTDEQIILHYLLNWVHGNCLPSDAVTVCDLYDRCHVWRKMFEEKGEDTLYFFTELKKKTEKSSRIDRETKCGGKWRTQKDNKIFHSSSLTNNEHIGSRRNLSFVPKKGRACECDDHQVKARTRWVMHEYRLDGILQKYCKMNNEVGSYVLCRVIKKVKKEEEIDDDNVHSNDKAMASVSTDSFWSYFDTNLCMYLADMDDDNMSFMGMQEQHASASDVAPVVSSVEADVLRFERALHEQDQLSHKNVNADDEINGLDYKKEKSGYLEDIVR